MKIEKNESPMVSGNISLADFGSLGLSLGDLADFGLLPKIQFSNDFLVREEGAKEMPVERQFRLAFPIYADMLSFLKSLREESEKEFLGKSASFIVQQYEIDEEQGNVKLANFTISPDFRTQMIFVSVSGGDCFIPKAWKKWKWENGKKGKK